MKDEIGIFEVIFAIFVFGMLCWLGFSILNIMRNAKPSDSNAQETIVTTYEPTTYQTTIINGTEYEIVPKE